MRAAPAAQAELHRVTRQFSNGDDPTGAPPPGMLFDISGYDSFSSGEPTAELYRYALRVRGWSENGLGVCAVLIRASGSWAIDYQTVHSSTFWARPVDAAGVASLPDAVRSALAAIVADPPQIGPRRIPRHPEMAYRPGFPTFSHELCPSTFFKRFPQLAFSSAAALVSATMELPRARHGQPNNMPEPSWLLPWLGSEWGPGACFVPYHAELTINRWLRSHGVAGTARTVAAQVLPETVLANIVHGTDENPYWPTLCSSVSCIPWLLFYGRFAPTLVVTRFLVRRFCVPTSHLLAETDAPPRHPGLP